MKNVIQQKSGFARFIQGTTAPGPIPWQVLLRRGSPSFSYITFFGGTIIDAKTILTAAHCIEKFDTKLDDFFIYAGAVSQYDNSGQNVFVESIKLHESYCNEACAAKGGILLDNDIAIVKLKNPLIFDDKVQPACLPDASFKPEGIAVASGWGRIQHNPQVVLDNLQVGIEY